MYHPAGDVPSAWAVHGALGLAQVIFGVGAVVAKLGLEQFNPLMFALIREGIAGPLRLARVGSTRLFSPLDGFVDR